ncbi:hypothetical protein K3495_g3000 [Podosphaera aphanis]|nr:hypothetical protein K3495_g3000 [Podosphaera aphanis]
MAFKARSILQRISCYSLGPEPQKLQAVNFFVGHGPRSRRRMPTAFRPSVPLFLRAVQLKRFSTTADAQPYACSEEHEELVPEQVRQIMRNVPQSVAILTTCQHPSWTNDPDAADSRGIGMTLSSVNTVTLKPDTIISFNIKKPSHTLEAVRYHGHFLIHFPTRSNAGARLADSFSKGVFQNKGIQNRIFCHHVPVPLENHQGKNILLPALLPPAYPVNYVLKCEVLGSNGIIDVVDHVIIIGKVQRTWCIDPGQLQFPQERFSLGYIQGAYCLTDPHPSS